MTEHIPDIGQHGHTVFHNAYHGLKHEAVFLSGHIDEMLSHDLNSLYDDEYDNIPVYSMILDHVSVDSSRQPVGENASEIGRLMREYKRHLSKQSLVRSLGFTVIKKSSFYIAQPRVHVQWEAALPRKPLGHEIEFMIAPDIHIRNEDEANRLKKVGLAVQQAISRKLRYYIDNIHIDTAELAIRGETCENDIK